MVMVRCKSCGHIDYADVPYNSETSFEGENRILGECGGFVIRCACGSTSFDVISQTGHPTPSHTGINVEHRPISGSSFDSLQASLNKIEQKLQEIDNRLKELEQKP